MTNLELTTNGPWLAKGDKVMAGPDTMWVVAATSEAGARDVTRDQLWQWPSGTLGSEANATLIAAARELYNALEAARRLILAIPPVPIAANFEHKGSTAVLAQVEDALKKAQGE